MAFDVGLKNMGYVCLLSSCSLTLAISLLTYLAANDWFGAGDWTSFAGISIPFSLLLPKLILTFRDPIKGPLSAAIIGILIGALLGVIWTFAVAGFLGPWFGAFSFPVGAFWILAGSVTGLVASRLAPKPNKTARSTRYPHGVD